MYCGVYQPSGSGSRFRLWSCIQTTGGCRFDHTGSRTMQPGGKENPKKVLPTYFNWKRKNICQAKGNRCQLPIFCLRSRKTSLPWRQSEGILRCYTIIKGRAWIKKNIIGKFKKNRFSFAEVSKSFKLIENNTTAVFINREKTL